MKFTEAEPDEGVKLSWSAEGDAPEAKQEQEFPAPTSERRSAAEWGKSLGKELGSIDGRSKWTARVGLLYPLLVAVLLAFGSVRLFPESREAMLKVWEGIKHFSLGLEDIQAVFDAEGDLGFFYWFGGAVLAFFGFLIGWTVATRSKQQIERRRLVIPRALISWLSEELWPDSLVQLALEPVPHSLNGMQRWLSLQLTLRDRTELVLHAEFSLRSEGRRELREVLSIELQLPRDPREGRAAEVLERLKQASSDEASSWTRILEGPPPKLIGFEVEGRHVAARFETPWGPAEALRANMRVISESHESPSVVPAGWTLRAVEDLLELLPAGRPQGLAEPPKLLV